MRDRAADEHRHDLGVGYEARLGTLDQSNVVLGESALGERVHRLAPVLVIDLVLGDLFHGHRQVVLRP